MNKVIRLSTELGPEVSFAAEHWLSSQKIQRMAQGTKLFDIAAFGGKGSTGKEERPIFLDTNAANNGLLDISSILNGKNGERTSHKKSVSEGCVIMSRLRPYLRQVAFIPTGLFELMGCSDILCSTEFYILQPLHPDRSIAFLTAWLLTDEVQEIFHQATTGGHHPRFEREMLLELAVPNDIVAHRQKLSKDVTRVSLGHISAQLEMKRLIHASSP